MFSTCARAPLFFLFVLIVGSCGSSDEQVQPTAEPITSEVIPNSLELIRADMSEPHAAIPRGVPTSMDWRERPRVGWGNTPPEDWSAMTTWGQVYAAAGTNAPVNTRVQIKNLKTWYLSKATGEWVEWQHSSNVGGANYAEDFQDDVNVPADIRQEATGGISVTIPDGYNFHFWPEEGRVEMDPTDIAAVWSAIDARLVLDNPNGPEDRVDAQLMMSAGADYWLNRAAEWDQWKTNGDIGIGRFRLITPDWQTYNMHTMSAEILRDNPPPI